LLSVDVLKQRHPELAAQIDAEASIAEAKLLHGVVDDE
jgi:hypothetical protein